MDFTLAGAWAHAILQAEGITAPVLVGQVGRRVSFTGVHSGLPGEVRGFVSIDSAPLMLKYMSDKEFWMLNHMAPLQLHALENTAVPLRRALALPNMPNRTCTKMVAQYSLQDEFCGLMKHRFILPGPLGRTLGTISPAPASCCAAGTTKPALPNALTMWGLRANTYPLTWVRMRGTIQCR